VSPVSIIEGVVTATIGIVALLFPRVVRGWSLRFAAMRPFGVSREYVRYMESAVFLVGTMIVGSVLLVFGVATLLSLFGVHLKFLER